MWFCLCVLGLTDDVARGLEGQLHNALILVRGGQVKDGEDVLPAWADVCRLGVNHLGYTAHHHVSDGGRPGESELGGGQGLGWRGQERSNHRGEEKSE